MGMLRRLTAVTAALVCAGVLLAGCGPSPAESPTPTPLTRAQAFAAAEATYRSYIDALNKVDLAKPATFENVYKWETGDALAGAKKLFTTMHGDGWVVSGHTVATLVTPSAGTSSSTHHLTLAVCVDVSDVTLVDKNGKSVVAKDRAAVQPMSVSLTNTQSDSQWRISMIDGREAGPPCT